MTMKLLIGYGVLAVCSLVSLYFAYSLVRFAVVGRRIEESRTNALTVTAFLAVIASAGLWFWALHRFVDDPNWYFKERLTMAIGVALCVVAIALSRLTARRTSVPVIAGALVVALNWIVSIIRD